MFNFSSRRRLMLLVMLWFGGFAGQGHPADLAIVGAKVYPSPEAAPIEDAVIVVHDGRIAAVGPRGRVRLPSGATFIDGTGRVVTAGFWNSHVHIFTHELLHVDQRTDEALSLALDGMLNRWGFTTVFDIASIFDNTKALRARINSGKVRGPNLLTVGEPFFPRSGPPIYIRKFLADEHLALPEDASIAAAVQREQQELHSGADGVKLFTGDIVGGAVGVDPMPLDLATALVAEAHREGKPVFAHPTNMQGLNIAVDSGVDILAHTTEPEAGAWTPALIRRIMDHHMALIPTLTLFDVDSRRAGLSETKIEATLKGVVAELRDFHAAGGEVLFGTDVGYIDKFDTAEEFRLMHDAEMDYRAILASLTTTPAKRLGYAARTGEIAEGLDADLVVLAGDPAEDATAFSRVAYTIRDGMVIYRVGQPPR